MHSAQVNRMDGLFNVHIYFMYSSVSVCLVSAALVYASLSVPSSCVSPTTFGSFMCLMIHIYLSHFQLFVYCALRFIFASLVSFSVI